MTKSRLEVERGDNIINVYCSSDDVDGAEDGVKLWASVNSIVSPAVDINIKWSITWPILTVRLFGAAELRRFMDEVQFNKGQRITTGNPLHSIEFHRVGNRVNVTMYTHMTRVMREKTPDLDAVLQTEYVACSVVISSDAIFEIEKVVHERYLQSIGMIDSGSPSIGDPFISKG